MPRDGNSDEPADLRVDRAAVASAQAPTGRERQPQQAGDRQRQHDAEQDVGHFVVPDVSSAVGQRATNDASNGVYGDDFGDVLKPTNVSGRLRELFSLSTNGKAAPPQQQQQQQQQQHYAALHVHDRRLHNARHGTGAAVAGNVFVDCTSSSDRQYDADTSSSLSPTRMDSETTEPAAAAAAPPLPATATVVQEQERAHAHAQAQAEMRRDTDVGMPARNASTKSLAGCELAAMEDDGGGSVGGGAGRTLVRNNSTGVVQAGPKHRYATRTNSSSLSSSSSSSSAAAGSGSDGDDGGTGKDRRASASNSGNGSRTRSAWSFDAASMSEWSASTAGASSGASSTFSAGPADSRSLALSSVTTISSRDSGSASGSGDAAHVISLRTASHSCSGISSGTSGGAGDGGIAAAAAAAAASDADCDASGDSASSRPIERTDSCMDSVASADGDHDNHSNGNGGSDVDGGTGGSIDSSGNNGGNGGSSGDDGVNDVANNGMFTTAKTTTKPATRIAHTAATTVADLRGLSHSPHGQQQQQQQRGHEHEHDWHVVPQKSIRRRSRSGSANGTSSDASQRQSADADDAKDMAWKNSRRRRARHEMNCSGLGGGADADDGNSGACVGAAGGAHRTAEFSTEATDASPSKRRHVLLEQQPQADAQDDVKSALTARNAALPHSSSTRVRAAPMTTLPTSPTSCASSGAHDARMALPGGGGGGGEDAEVALQHHWEERAPAQQQRQEQVPQCTHLQHPRQLHQQQWRGDERQQRYQLDHHHHHHHHQPLPPLPLTHHHRQQQQQQQQQQQHRRHRHHHHHHQHQHQQPSPASRHATRLPLDLGLASQPDDKDGHVTYSVGEALNTTPEFPTGRYQIVGRLGEGTFGKVVSCWDRRTEQLVAVKVIRSVRKYIEAARLEIDVLLDLARHDAHGRFHCVRLLSYCSHGGHQCLVFEHLGPSLFDILLCNSFRPLPVPILRTIAKQMLESIAFMHDDMNVVHTDLKPENLLVIPSSYYPTRQITENVDVRLVDFGSASRLEPKQLRHAVVSTRHYRAPEVILGVGWSFACDIWSLGCMLVEMYTGAALFQTHEDLEHLAMISRLLRGDTGQKLKLPPALRSRAAAGNSGHGGVGCDDEMANGAATRAAHDGDAKTAAAAADARVTSTPAQQQYFYADTGELKWPEGIASDAARQKSVRRLERMRQLEHVFRPEDADLLDVVRACFTLDPERRVSARDLLRHRFFAGAAGW